MLKIIDYPSNPDGQEIQGFPFPLLTEKGRCAQSVTLTKPRGEQLARKVEFTSQSARMVDDLLALPGVDELALYENWSFCGRCMFIGLSGALSWDEFWVVTKPYFDEVVRESPRHETLAQLITEARRALDQPVVLVERSHGWERHFTIHTRHPLTKKKIIRLGADSIRNEPLRLLFESIQKEVDESDIWIMPYIVTVDLPESLKKEDVDATIARVIALFNNTLYPKQKVSVRERRVTNEIDPDDDDYGWADD